MLHNSLRWSLKRTKWWLGIASLSVPLTSFADLSVSTELEEAIAQYGNVNVIVGLDIPFTPEGYLTPAQVTAQRTAISQQQTTFNDDLVQDIEDSGLIDFPNTGSTPDLTKHRFEGIPYVIMEVNALSLPFLQSSGNIDSIKLAVTDEPALAEVATLTGATALHSVGFGGSGQTVVVLDSGSSTTSELDACFSTIDGCPNGEDAQQGIGAAAPCDYDNCEHGTAVTDMLKAVVPEANIISIQIASNVFGGARFPEENQLFALDYINNLADTQTINAVNMSYGRGEYHGVCNIPTTKNEDGRLAAIQNLVSKGVAVIAGSGNKGQPNALHKPACYAEVISVGASNKLGEIWSDTNRNANLDLLALGAGIDVTLSNGESSVKSGTSLAAPVVAGSFALLKQLDPTLNSQSILQLLKDTGDKSTGFPRVDLNTTLLAYQTVCDGDIQLPHNLCNGLQAYYPLEGSANDASSREQHATAYNVDFTQGVKGRAGIFDGSGYIRKENFNFSANALTVSAWAKLTTYPMESNSRAFFAIHSGGGGTGAGDKTVKLQINPDKRMYPILTTEDGQKDHTSPSSIVADPTQWHQYTFVRKANGLQSLYIDGVRVRSVVETNLAAEFFVANGLLEIGAANYYDGGWDHDYRQTKWDGLLDEIYVYDRELSDLDVQRLFEHSGGTPANAQIGCSADSQLPDNLCDGLLAHYELNGDAQELTGNAPDGVLTDVTATTDRAGNATGAVLFADAASQVVISDMQNLQNTAHFTVNAWVKSQGTGAIVNQFTGCPDAAPEYKGNSFELTITPQSNVRFAVKSGTGNFYEADNRLVTDAIIPQDDQWYMLTGVFDHGELKVYINAAQDTANTTHYTDGYYLKQGDTLHKPPAESSQFSIMADASEDVLIGSYVSWCQDAFNTYPFKGAIDDVKLYNRALSAAEIQTLHDLPLTAKPPTEDGSDDNSQDPDTQLPATVSVSLTKTGKGVFHLESYPSCWVNKTRCEFEADGGAALQITAKAQTGYAFTGWGTDCALYGSSEKIIVAANSDLTCTANFTPVPSDDQRVLTLEVIGDGRISVAGFECLSGQPCQFSYPLDKKIWLKAHANDDQQFVEWLGEQCLVANTSHATSSLTMHDNYTCKALFVAKDTFNNPQAIIDFIENIQVDDLNSDIATNYPTPVLDETMLLVDPIVNLVSMQISIDEPNNWVEHLVDKQLYSMPAGQYVKSVLVKKERYIEIRFIDDAYVPIAIVFGEESDGGVIGGMWHSAIVSPYYIGYSPWRSNMFNNLWWLR